jgi:uncharacterized protein YdaU (DUF1376 family)
MTTQPWYPFYWSDYSGKTMHLTQGQHGAYFLLLRWIYTTGKPIPHKARFSIAQARLESERSDAQATLDQFFERRGAFWHNLRAEEIMQAAEDKRQKLIEAGRVGGLKRSSHPQATLKPPLSEAQATRSTPRPREESKKKDSFNGFVVENGNGKNKGLRNGHSVTIQDPIERIARFQQKLLPELGTGGHMIIAAACDAKHPDHQRALTACKLAAKSIGKGWPDNWPTNLGTH